MHAQSCIKWNVAHFPPSLPPQQKKNCALSPQMNKFLVVCLALLAAGAFASSVVEETQFEQVVSLSRSAPLIVLFYRSSNADAQQAQAVLDEVAASNTHPIKLLKCDGDLEANKQSYEGAGFGDKTFVFTAMGEEGITKYNGVRFVLAHTLARSFVLSLLCS